MCCHTRVCCLSQYSLKSVEEILGDGESHRNTWTGSQKGINPAAGPLSSPAEPYKWRPAGFSRSRFWSHCLKQAPSGWQDQDYEAWLALELTGPSLVPCSFNRWEQVRNERMKQMWKSLECHAVCMLPSQCRTHLARVCRRFIADKGIDTVPITGPNVPQTLTQLRSSRALFIGPSEALNSARNYPVAHCRPGPDLGEHPPGDHSHLIRSMPRCCWSAYRCWGAINITEPHYNTGCDFWCDF